MGVAEVVADFIRFLPYLLNPRTVVIHRFSRALGDNLMLSVLAREVKRRHPRRPVVLVTNWPELFKGNPHVDLVVESKVAPRYRKPGYRIDGQTTTHIVDQLAESLGLDLGLVDRRPELYLEPDEVEAVARDLPDGYVVVCPVGKGTVAANRKDWGFERFQELVGLLPGTPFVQVGMATDPLLEGVLNRRGLRVRASAAVLAGAKTAILLEGGLMHLACAVGTPCVLIYGAAVRPEVSLYDLHLALTAPGPCGPCFRSHGRPGSCDDQKCMAAIPPWWVASLLKGRRYEWGGVLRAGENEAEATAVDSTVQEEGA